MKGHRHFFFLPLVALASAISTAQTLNVCVYNAKSGKPLTGKNVTVNWDLPGSEPQRLNASGCAVFSVPRKATNFGVSPGPKEGREPYRVAYTSCNNEGGKVFLVKDVLKEGLAMENICGKARRTALPSQVIFWALPRPFLDFQ